MRGLAIVVLGMAAACGAQAQLYKWTDENGRVQYTQTPPPPGRQAQEIKPQASKPAAGPAAPSPGVPPSDAGQKSAGKGKGGKADDTIPSDALRMLGEWRTHPGARVQVRFQVQRGAGSNLVSAQQWAVGNDTHAVSGMKVVVSGDKGAGSIAQDTADKLPATLGYELRGDGLILTVASGPFAGTHLLTRQQ